MRLGFGSPALALLASLGLTLGSHPVDASEARYVEGSRIDSPAGESATEPARRVGKLPNGLFYAIERAGKPGDKIGLFLVVRAGSADAMPDEPDAAHVLEHIVVKKLRDQGSKGSYADRLARMGGREGRDANASTQIDLSTYSLLIPPNDASAFDTGLDFLADWASPMEITNEDVDRERKAVIEEARQSYSAASHWEQLIKHRSWYPGHPVYGLAPSPVGTARASTATVRKLHRRLYNPRNMAVVIVGPVDPETVLRQITVLMGSISPGPLAAANNLAVRSLAGGRYEAITHEDQRETKVSLTYANRVPPAGSADRARDEAVRRVLAILLGDAFRNLTDDYGAAIYSGGISMAAENNDAQAAGIVITSIDTVVRADRIDDALGELLRLVATARRDGFAAEDVARARSSALAAITDEADSTDEALERWVGYFRFGAIGPERRDFRHAIERLTADDIQGGLAKLFDPARRDIFVTHAPANANVPGMARVSELIARAERAAPMDLSRPPIEPPSFTPAWPADAGEVEGVRDADGYVRWSLPRSGATLLFKRTEGKTAEIAMLRIGGASRFDAADAGAALAAGDIVRASGIGTLDIYRTNRFLTSRGLSVAPITDIYREGVTASGPSELWTMVVKLARAQLVQPQLRAAAFDDWLAVRRDASSQNAIATVLRERLEVEIAKALARPRPAFAGGTPELERIGGLYVQMLSDTRGMAIVVHGDLEAADVYSAAASALDIPAGHVAPPPRQTKTIETKASRHVIGGGKGAAIVELIVQAAAADPRLGEVARQIDDHLKDRLTARLRGVEKGVYVVSVGFSVTRSPGVVSMNIGFSCDLSNVERLIEAAKDELSTFRTNGFGSEAAPLRVVRPVPRDAGAIGVAEAWVVNQAEGRPRGDHFDFDKWRRDFFDPARLAEFLLVPGD